MSGERPDEGRNPDVPGNPDRRNPLPLSAEGESVDANPPVDEPVGRMPNSPDGPEYDDDEAPEEGDRSPYTKDED